MTKGLKCGRLETTFLLPLTGRWTSSRVVDDLRLHRRTRDVTIHFCSSQGYRFNTTINDFICITRKVFIVDIINANIRWSFISTHRVVSNNHISQFRSFIQGGYSEKFWRRVRPGHRVFATIRLATETEDQNRTLGYGKWIKIKI